LYGNPRHKGKCCDTDEITKMDEPRECDHHRPSLTNWRDSQDTTDISGKDAPQDWNAETKIEDAVIERDPSDI